MGGFWTTAGIWALLVLLLVVNAGGVALVAFQLPGTWVMLAATVVVALVFGGERVGWVACAIMAVLALAGEVIEFVAGSMGAKKAGGSKRSVLLATAGGVIGALAGTVALPVPVVGTVVGACAGAWGAAALGDRWAGRSWEEAFKTGKGAAVGRFWGTLAKLGIAVAMWVVAAVAVFWP